ncbi:MAG: hypothetical protein ACUVWX_09680 [Kiritimatiellia bacterium]
MTFSLAVAAWAIAAPYPPWKLPDCETRAVFEFPDRAMRSVLVGLPNEDGLTIASRFVAVDSFGRELPSRVVHVDEDKAYVLVCFESRQGATGFLYYSASGSQSSDSAQPLCMEQLPVFVEVQRGGGKSAPNTWEKMLFLYGSKTQRRHVVARAYFEDIPFIPYEEERRPEERARTIVVHMRTILLCRESGEYSFAIDCCDAGFLLVDGEHAAEWPGEHPPGQWRVGSPLLLKAGPHVLDFYGCMLARMPPRLGWLPPGKDRIQMIPREALITGAIAEPVRIERKDRSLHVGFAYDILPAYSFRGLPHVFIPVRFRNMTRNWVTDVMSSFWSFDGMNTSTNRDAVHIFRGATVHTASLLVRDALGFSASATATVDCRHVQPQQYALSCAISELPAVCFPSDMITPVLRIAGVVPEGFELAADWQVERRSGEIEKFVAPFNLGGACETLKLTTIAAGKVSRVTWRVRHENLDLFSGTVLFLRPEFAMIPVRVEADYLYDRTGNQVVLIPHDVGGRYFQPSCSWEMLQNGILILDDFLEIPLATSTRNEKFLRQALEQSMGNGSLPLIHWIRFVPRNAENGAFDPLHTLVEAARIAAESESEVVVLTLGRLAWRSGYSVEMFERHAAALSDLLSGTMKKFVVWGTVPPYPANVDRARAFAAAIRRVADARGIPVADLYSGILGAENSRELFVRGHDVALSGKGQKLAGCLIAKALPCRASRQ